MDIETSEHALRDCTWAHDFWESSSFGIDLQAADENESLHD